MRQVFFLISGFIVIMAAGCGSNDKEAKPDSSAVSTPINTAVTPVTNPVISTTPSTTTTSQPVTTNTAGLNPAHGQPGHRCDISVGAPLNSPPGKATTPVVNTNAAPSNVSTSTNISPQIVTTPPTQTVAAGMNPAHGQSGHRCDIPVGSPLNSPIKKNK